MKIHRYIVVIAVGTFCSLHQAHAQATSYGADKWTGQMQQRGLFRPRNLVTSPCNATTEVPVVVPYDPANPAPNPLPANAVGFCIEKVKRSATTWEDARNECARNNRRLPEPGEFLVACKFASQLGISDFNSDFEWASNSPFLSTADNANFLGTVTHIIQGNPCTRGSFGLVAANNGAGDPAPYRCVR